MTRGFISYPRADSWALAHVQTALNAKLTDVDWVVDVCDPTLLGAAFWPGLLARIGEAEVIALVWSEATARSPWILFEHIDARVAAGHGARLIPVLLDDTPLPPWLSRLGGIDLRPHLPWWRRLSRTHRKRSAALFLAAFALAWLVLGDQVCLPSLLLGLAIVLTGPVRIRRHRSGAARAP